MKGYIYKILNPNGKIYIGQTNNIEKRKRDYSNKRCKGQKLIYRSIEKYGWERHKFDIILGLNDINRIDEIEIFFIKFYKSYNIENSNGLNLTTGGKSMRGYKKTPEDIKKMSDSLKGKSRKWTESAKIKLSETRKRQYREGELKHPALGVKRSLETCLLISSKKIGKTISEETRQILKAAQQKALKKIGHGRNIKRVYQYTKEGFFIKEWCFVKQASKELGINNSDIGAVCHNRKKSAGGYRWLYEKVEKLPAIFN